MVTSNVSGLGFSLFSRWTGRVLSFVVALPVLLWGSLHAVLLYSDLRIDFFLDSVQQTLSPVLERHNLKVEGIALKRSDSGHIALSLEGVEIFSQDEAVVASLPEVNVRVFAMGFFSFPFRPLSLEVKRADVTFTYGRDGSFSTDLRRLEPDRQDSHVAHDRTGTEKEGNPDSSDVAESFPFGHHRTLRLGPKDFPSYVQSLHVLDVNIVWVHGLTRARRQLEGVNFSLNSVTGGLHMIGHVPWDQDKTGRMTHMNALLKDSKEGVSISGLVNNLYFPMFLRNSASMVALSDLPLEMAFQVSFDADRRLIDADLDLNLRKGAEAGRFDGNGTQGTMLVSDGAVHMHYDAEARIVTIDKSHIRFGSDDFLFSGRIIGSPRSSKGSHIWDCSLSVQDVVSSGDRRWFDRDAGDMIHLQGSLDFGQEVYTLDHGKFAIGPTNFTITADSFRKQGKMQTQLNGHLMSMHESDVFAAWPLYILPSVRDWVLNHVRSAILSDARWKVGFEWDTLLRGGPGSLLRSGDVLLTADFEGIDLAYLAKVPLLEDAKGRLTLDGARFRFDLGSGYIAAPDGGRVLVSDASFEIPDVRFAIPKGRLSLRTVSDVPDLLWLFDHDPFQIVSASGYELSSFDGGKAILNLGLSIPLEADAAFEDMGMEGTAELHDVSVRNFWMSDTLHNGEFLVNIRDGTFFLAGGGTLSGSRLDVELSSPILRGKEGTPPPEIILDFAPRTHDLASGLKVSGPLRMTIIPEQREEAATSDRNSFAVHVDLYRAQIEVPALDYQKLPGQDAYFLTEVSVSPETLSYEFGRVEFYDGDIVLQGLISLGPEGNFRRGDFRSFAMSQFDDTSLVLEIEDSGSVNLVLSGRVFDLRGVLRLINAAFYDVSGAASWDRDIALAVQLDKAIGEYGVVLDDLRMNASFVSGALAGLDLKGRFGTAPLEIHLVEGSAGHESPRLEINSGNAAAALRFAGVYHDLDAGKLSVSVDWPSTNSGSSGAHGRMMISDFYVTGEYAQALLSHGERVGESEVRFDELRTEFSASEGVISFRDSVLKGPSSGIVAHGSIDIAHQEVDLVGTYIPIYTLNNLLGHLPIIGEVLVGGESGGLVGLNFAVRGSLRDPQVVVNPVSLITPGFLRNLLSFRPLGSKNGAREGKASGDVAR